MPDSKHCPTHLIADDPAEHDEFRCHDRVAEAIVDLVRSDEGGKTIGLSGVWGSGKSTIVELFRGKLRGSDPNAQVFIFDAWAHEGDPLRRTFLEKLIGFLIELKWVKKDRWEKEKDDLSRKHREEHVTTTPKLTVTGKLCGVFALLVPVGVALFSAGSSRDGLSWMMFLGAPLSVSPLLVFLGRYFREKLGKRAAKRRWFWFIGCALLTVLGLAAIVAWEFWPVALPGALLIAFAIGLLGMCPWKEDVDQAAQLQADVRAESGGKEEGRKRLDLLPLLIKTSETETESETIESPEPTSVEFADRFARLLAEALASDQKGEDGGEAPDKRKLTLVLDNLDRVAPCDALKIWSTMRTFVEIGTKLGHEWYKRLWIVLPFDRSGLKRLWAEAKSSVEAGRAMEGSELAQVFVEKTCQVVIEVPPPVVSKWKKFLIARLDEALPEHNRDDFHIVYQVYVRYGTKEDVQPTPRDLKLFINSIGALHRQWNDEIPLVQQAYYVLRQKEGEQILKDLKNEEFPEPELALLLGPDVRKNLAALYYNVPPEVATQVLIGGDVRKALSEGQGTPLQALKDLEGFNETCRRIVEEILPVGAKIEPRQVPLAAAALGELDVSVDHSWRAVWNRLCDSASVVENWVVLNDVVGKGVAATVRHRAEKRFLQAVVRAVAKTPIREPEAAEEKLPERDRVKQWLLGASEVLRAVRDIDPAVCKTFRTPEPPGVYLLLLQEAASSMPDDLWEYLVPEAAPSAVMNELVKSTSDGRFNERWADAVAVMLRIGVEWPWSSFVSQLNGRLQATTNAAIGEAKSSLRTMLRLRQVAPETEAMLDSLAKQGHLMDHLQRVSDGKDPEAIALFMLPVLDKNPLGNQTQDAGSSEAGTKFYNNVLADPGKYTNIVEVFADLVVEFSMLDRMFQVAEEAKNAKAFLGSIVARMVEGDPRSRLRAPKLLMSKYSLLREWLQDQQLDGLIQESVREDNLCGELMARKFDTSPTGLCNAALRGSGVDDPKFLEFVKEGLRGLDKAAWKSELVSEGGAVGMLIFLSEKGHGLGLTTWFHDGLLEHARALLSGTTKVEKYKRDWTRLLQNLETNQRETLKANLFDLIVDFARRTDVLLGLYDKDLSHCKFLEEKADRLVRVGGARFLERKNLRELSWFSKVLESCEGVLRKCGEANRNTLADRVNTALKENPEGEVLAELQKLARLLGLKPPDLEREKSHE